ncbi:AAA family ATPase [Arthrobacter livingstonensis]|uniref:AAA family ATPase n=1 Tax=Arthrobacter livingstonensis TaxID=670078 RepID=A0A2V5L873_9MICC|nr:AAA family ATPase [Arthrobacter livingstonensis]PYI67821.1 AAA family ATPase [Arthrobacter livingstonensis]
MLTAIDPLPARPRRILVAGVSGSGKTTLAGRIGAVLNVPHVEIDSLFHGPDWTPRESFVQDVAAFTGAPGWVTERQYRQVRQLLAQRAELLVWLDFPFPFSMWRPIRRTVRRRLRRQELWNGNIEPAFHTIFTDPGHIIRWGWRARNKLKAVVPGLEQEIPGLHVVRLSSPRDVDAWVDNLQLAVTSGW